MTSILIQWNSCSMGQTSVLGVATLTYLPFCFFNILSPIMTLLVAATKFKIVESKEIMAKAAADELAANPIAETSNVDLII